MRSRFVGKTEKTDYCPYLCRTNRRRMEGYDKVIAKLVRNGFGVFPVPDVAAAGLLIRQQIEGLRPESISFGDSMTLYATGTVDWLRRQNDFPLIDTFEKGVRFKELIERRRRALLCHTFLTGVNAVSASDGTLYWLDMIGNRIAPVAFGPRHVILVAGVNKIVETPEEAYRRIREEAAPRNVARHEGMKTPCAVTGRCSDCSSPDRICNERLILHKCHPKGRISLVLIGQDLGL